MGTLVMGTGWGWGLDAWGWGGDGDNVTGMGWGWGCKFIPVSIFSYNVHNTRSSAIAERLRVPLVIKYFDNSLKVTRGHSK